MSGGAATALVDVGSPLADMGMVACIVVGAVVGGASGSDVRILLGLAMVASMAGDGIFLYQEATTGYVGG